MKIISVIKQNIVEIFKSWFVLMSTTFSILSIILSFITWEEMNKNQLCDKIFIFFIIIITTLVLSIVYICFCKRKNTKWKNGTGEINICYSDIIKKSFPRKNKKKKIVVIPVNTCFDTQLDSDITLCDKPLISENSIHGNWIKSMIDNGINKESIDKSIEDYIKLKNYSPIKELSSTEKNRGKTICYDTGTIVAISGKQNVTFLLLALSEFNENNNAQSSKEILIKCLYNLVSFYNENCQGYKMYVPLMGTGLSRANLSHIESLHTIYSMFQLYSNKIHGEINIIIYYKDKDKVSIFN